jgi:2-C-methyl-D-erythritol 4-phosphate cytidylyltransferase/2-C-methyl-D-erythritol 2,4-cyclodiphosphate synthase
MMEKHKPMTQASEVYALILAGGNGVRFGEKDKLWQALGNYPVWYHGVLALLSHPQLCAGAIVVPESKQEAYELALQYLSLPKPLAVLPCAGQTRQESSYNGLKQVPEEFEWVAVHDAARPFVPEDMLTRLIEAAKEWGAAIPALPVTDTIKCVGEDGLVQTTLERNRLWAIQTPQLFRINTLYEAHRWAYERGIEATDDASLLEKQGGAVYCVPGDASNLKVTTPEDIRAAQSYLEGVSGALMTGIRVGIGYDIHSLAEGRRLILGGVPIEHSAGLFGHSDADAVTHAICDALLGAATLGDIGQHFPNTDPQWKDANSLEILRHVTNLLRKHRWHIRHVDAMILAQAPRLMPYLPRMAALLSEAMRIQPSQVSLKATTMEGLDAVGREEGIACHAVATIETIFHKEEHHEQNDSQSSQDRKKQHQS